MKDEFTTRRNIGLCLEVYDLAASKLVAYRDKDREFVRLLFIEEMIDANVLLTQINELSIEKEIQQRLISWVKITSQDL